MGKSRRTTQDVQQRQTADTTFSNAEFTRQLQEQIQRQREQFQRQDTQQQAARQETGVDAASQEFINQMRQRALSSLGAITPEAFAPSAGQINALTSELMNPFISQVVEGVGSQFDRLRAQAATDANQAATAAGAFGGSRHGVAQAVRQAELDRAESQQVAGLLSDAFRQAQQSAIPLAAQQALAPVEAARVGQALLAGSLGPTGQVSTSTGTSTGRSSGSSVSDALSQLVNLGFGQTTGRSSSASSMTGRTTNTEHGNLFNDILALGTMLAAFVPGGGAVGALGGALGGR